MRKYNKIYWIKLSIRHKIRNFFSNFRKKDTYTKNQIINKIIKVSSHTGMTSSGAALVREITGEDGPIGRTLPSAIKTTDVEKILEQLQKDCNINIKWWWKENKSKWIL